MAFWRRLEGGAARPGRIAHGMKHGAGPLQEDHPQSEALEEQPRFNRAGAFTGKPSQCPPTTVGFPPSSCRTTSPPVEDPRQTSPATARQRIALVGYREDCL